MTCFDIGGLDKIFPVRYTEDPEETLGFFMGKISLNIEDKKRSLDFDQHLTHLAKINEALSFGVAENYHHLGLTYIDVPEIVGITGACENIDTLFRVGNRLELPLFITQTGQLSLEQALQSFSGVFTVVHSGRDEEKEDQRHLRQFRLTEEEFDCSLAGMTREGYEEEEMFEALLDHIQKAIRAIIRRALERNKKALEEVYKRDLTELKQALKKDFLRITYEKAVNLLNKNGYPDLRFGDDFKAKHEAKIVSLVNKRKKQLPVFITKYPKEMKFFNMKVYSKDPRVVLSADLIFPYSGEGVGSAVREHNFKKLNDRLLSSEMFRLHLKRGGKYSDFKWYLDIIKNKRTLPHAGYGIGNERVLQYILGAADIRNVSLFSLLNRQTGDWDRKRYGQSAVFVSNKKYILLSIGQLKNKKLLAPFIKKIAQKPNFILYATEKTHQFLKKQGIITSLVYKISQIGRSPNIADLLGRCVFDIIINIPTRKKINKSSREFTDGKLIRKGAIETGVYLVTDPEVAIVVLKRLANQNKL